MEMVTEIFVYLSHPCGSLPELCWTFSLWNLDDI